MKKTSAILIGLTLGNFLFAPNFDIAMERTFFQAVAIACMVFLP